MVDGPKRKRQRGVGPVLVTRGTVLHAAEAAGFTLTRSRHLPGARLPSHAHEHASLVYVLRGHFRETAGPWSMDCAPGGLLYKPPGHEHANLYGDERVYCLTIALLPARYDQLAAGVAGASRLLFTPSPAAALPAWRMVRELADPGSASEPFLEGLTLELLAACFGGTSPRTGAAPRWLGRVRDYLHQRLDGCASLGEAASLAGVHPIHLAREFRRHYRTSVGEYSRRVRIGEAARRLRCESTPLARIAHDLGFADQSHFGRVFRRYAGRSPDRFRGRPDPE